MLRVTTPGRCASREGNLQTLIASEFVIGFALVQLPQEAEANWAGQLVVQPCDVHHPKSALPLRDLQAELEAESCNTIKKSIEQARLMGTLETLKNCLLQQFLFRPGWTKGTNFF